jgi:hypothetical protein
MRGLWDDKRRNLGLGYALLRTGRLDLSSMNLALTSVSAFFHWPLSFPFRV